MGKTLRVWQTRRVLAIEGFRVVNAIGSTPDDAVSRLWSELSDSPGLLQMAFQAHYKTLCVSDDPRSILAGQWGSLQVVVLLFAGLACPAVDLAEFRFELAWLDKEFIERRLSPGMAGTLDTEPQKGGGCHVEDSVVGPVRRAAPMTVLQVISCGQEIVAGFGEAGFDVGALGGIVHRSTPSCSMLRASNSWWSRIVS